MNILIVFFAKYLIYGVLLCAAVLLFLEFYRTRNWRALGFVVLAVLTTILFNQLFHLIPVEAYRPYQLQGVSPLVTPSVDSPFPSDHVTLVFMVTFAVVMMTRFKKIGLVLLAAAFGVLAGRLLALVHSPLDVIGGVICAGLGAVWYYIYLRYYGKDSKKISNKKEEKPPLTKEK